MNKTDGMSIADRLEHYSMPEPNSGCRIWLGAHFKKGYGAIRVGKKIMRAHRAAWAEYRGPVPNNFLVCHHCDNRLCVNPDHLFLGTPKENSKDMTAKGRQSRGPRHGEATRRGQLGL